MTRNNAYKDSGVEWIGVIPVWWKIKRLKTVSDIIPSNIDKKSKENEKRVLLCNYVDVYKNDFITDRIDFMEATASDLQIERLSISKGDVIATKDSEDPNDIGVAALVKETMERVVCGYHLTLIRSDNHQLIGSFLFWLLRCKGCSQYFSTEARGITRYAIGTRAFNNLKLPVPSIEEQASIANYLDKRTAQIDTLISKKEKLIELLKEERSAMVNQAVTKGLHPDVRMKNSGIEWLGEIPEHWEVKKLRYIGEFQNGVSEGSEYFGSGYPFISYGDVYNNSVLPNSVKGLAQSTDKDQLRFSVKENDVFFTRTSETIEEIGLSSTCLATINEAVFSGFLIRFRPQFNFIDKEFSKYYFRCFIPRTFFTREMNLVTRASLSQELLKRLPIILPPLKEQSNIASFLDNKIKEIETTSLKINQEIELLKEYKTALISEVVTGKVDVRDEVLI